VHVHARQPRTDRPAWNCIRCTWSLPPRIWTSLSIKNAFGGLDVQPSTGVLSQSIGDVQPNTAFAQSRCRTLLVSLVPPLMPQPKFKVLFLIVLVEG
jgi:hypothetical protein